ncbi:putative hemolysin [Edaphobacter lichenicola]|uniref:Hemolysin n=1 Tax=Tunturiibacter lichenicola TaxID=2051959 RepID=A0A852VBM8_9BACT|nr:putative hemolysin [Edaphobacter lichenicola]
MLLKAVHLLLRIGEFIAVPFFLEKNGVKIFIFMDSDRRAASGPADILCLRRGGELEAFVAEDCSRKGWS